MIINDKEIILQADPLAIAERYVQGIKLKGREHVACCPLHDEKTPSWMLNVEKGVWHCQGCKEGGSMVDLVMQLDMCSYPDAIRKIAEICNLEVQESKNKKVTDAALKSRTDRAERIKAHGEAHNIYRAQNGEWSQENEDHCTWSYEIAGKVYLATTLTKWGAIQRDNSNVLLNSKIRNSILQEIGLVSYHEAKQSHYDTFYNRLCFPIRTSAGQIVGYTGRDITGKSKAKYINTKETSIFDKKQLLFGYYENRRAISKRGFAYIFEGPTDVIIADQYGISNAVATNGTAFTEYHAQMVKRMEHIKLVFDGDQAGELATMRAIEQLIKVQIRVSVVFLPEGLDPADYIACYGGEDFERYCDTQGMDGVSWLVMRGMPDSPSPFDLEAGISKAVDLLSNIESVTLISTYSNQIAKDLGTTSSNMRKLVEQRKAEVIEKGRTYTSQEQDQLNQYGIYTRHNCYFSESDHCLSNFTMKPIMLVIGNVASKYLLQFTNRHYSKALVVSTDELVSLGAFRKLIISKGKFAFRGSEMQYQRVLEMVQDDTKECYPITVMGTHAGGFYTWGNGIVEPDGAWQPVDERGCVTYDDKVYYLSAFSKIITDNLADDDSEQNNIGTSVVYYEGGMSIDFATWSKKYLQVFPEHGMISMMWYIACVYRSVVFASLNKYFPHLNCYGEHGSGKTFLSDSINSMFGSRPAAPLDQVSPAAMSRMMSQAKDMPQLFEEYTSDISPRMIAFLKGYADGHGRPLAKKDHTNETRMTPVRSGTIIVGQYLPNQDPALLERCITLMFVKGDISDEQRQAANYLKALEEDGVTTRVTSELYKYRPIVEQNIKGHLETCLADLKKAGNNKLSSRIVNSIGCLMATYKCLQDHVRFPFTYAELRAQCIDQAIHQHDQVKSGNEIAEWWSIVEYLISVKNQDNGLIEGDDWTVVYRKTVNCQPYEADGNVLLDVDTNVLYLRFDKAQKLYSKTAMSMGLKNKLTRRDLQQYLRTSEKAYIGYWRGKLSNGKQGRFELFDAKKLEMFGNDYMSPGPAGAPPDDTPPDTTPPINGGNDDLPF